MKYKFFSLFCLFSFQYLCGVFLTGDPFQHIKSTIPYINNYEEFCNVMSQDNYYVLIVSYQDNHFGKNEESFVLMAHRFDLMYKQLANHKKIKIYRAHMTKNIHPALYGFKNPSLQIYYQGKKIATLEGPVSKREISNFLQNNIFRSLNISFNLVDGGFDADPNDEDPYRGEEDENLIRFKI